MWQISPQEIINKASLMLSGEIKMELLRFCEGVGGSAGNEYLLCPNEIGIRTKTGLDWIYTARNQYPLQRFANNINTWHRQLKIGGRLIVHERLGVFEDRKHSSKLLCPSYVANLLQGRFSMVWSENVCGKDFASVWEKK